MKNETNVSIPKPPYFLFPTSCVQQSKNHHESGKRQNPVTSFFATESSEMLLASCKTLRFILAPMHLGVSHRSIWRQRVVGSLLVLPVEVVLCLLSLLPLQGVQLLVFAVLFVVYLAALVARDGRSAVAWLVYLCEGVALALFIRETGGAASPFQVLVYPWVFGSALTLLLDGSRLTVVPRLALFTALVLVVGARGTEGFVLFAVVNALALASMTAALMTQPRAAGGAG